MEMGFFVFLVKAFQFPNRMKWGSDLTKIKFKKGLLSKHRKVTEKIDLKLSKITSKQFSSNL